MKTVDQNRLVMEGLEAQNETLSMEVRRLSDKLRLASSYSALPPTISTSEPLPSTALPIVKNGLGGSLDREKLRASENGRVGSGADEGGRRDNPLSKSTGVSPFFLTILRDSF